MTTNNNYLEAKRFLETLFSRYFKDHDGKVELRCISANIISKFYGKGEFTETDWAEITELNKTHHIYVGVNPRPLDEKKKKENIRDLICLWADVDGKDFVDGKEGALRSVKAFPISPSIIIDSGHGYHCYWVLKEPLIGVNDEQLFVFKQVLAGVVKALQGDIGRVDHVTCLRLPGTMNDKLEEKGLEPVPCQTYLLTDKVYQIEEFVDQYRDETYHEPKLLSKEEWKFGTKNPMIRSDSVEHAAEDVEKLELKAVVKRHILTGAPRTEAGVDHTRSGRDWLIIKELIFADYNYATIQSIFLNPKLPCSNRIREKGEGELRHDVERAYEAIKTRHHAITLQAQAILQIRAMKLTGEQHRQEINHYIVDDLLTGPNPVGRGFNDVMSGTHYYFDNIAKEPWDINKKNSDFYLFMRERYDISRKDFDEIRDAVATEIGRHCPDVIVRRVAHLDEEQGVLYLSNHNNQILRIDGGPIRLLDNGEEGVFFHFDSRLSPLQFDEKKVREAVNCFETYTPEREFPWGTMGDGISFGLNLDTFYKDSLLNRYLISWANFASPDEENLVNESQQRLLLFIYFYSLFFESLMKHKPIVAFLGLAHSGKSTTATAIGKILFGEGFKGGTIPHDARSLKQVMGEHYYYLIENLDDRVSSEVCDVLAGTSTGAGSEERALGENRGSVFIDTHCFVVITSREPKFKRPDVVDRLLVFRMGKIEEEKVKSPTKMERMVLEHRQEIMTEVISNLNSIVWILRRQKEWEKEQGPDYEPPGNIFRIADYEEFGKKVCSLPSRLQFRWALEALMSEKAVMTVEEDPIYQIISYIVFDMDEGLRELSLQQLYTRMKQAAMTMEMSDFGDKWGKYPTAQSVAQRLPHIQEAMSERLYVDIRTRGTGTNSRKFYTFLRMDQWPVKLPAPAAKLLNLDPTEEYDPQLVLDRMGPEAKVTKEALIKAFGVRR